MASMACRNGWVVARSAPDFSDLRIELTSDLAPIFATAGPRRIIAIDIPIGIPDNEPRLCDTAARRLLGWPRSSSVFSPPSRRALNAQNFREALRLNRDAIGVGISKQAFHIANKIREVDELMTSARQRFVYEVHPEVTFAQLNGGPLKNGKKSANGRRERITLLRRSGLKVRATSLWRQRSDLGLSRVFFDDLVDALACLVTASAILNGRSQLLGRPDQIDAKGLVMQIVCTNNDRMPPISGFWNPS
jgi:predicted RNase H-like nuclease